MPQPQPVTVGADLQAGTLNLTGPLTVRATAPVEDSFLAEMVRLMEAAEVGRCGYRRVADRASELYTPLVHVAALASFVGWLVATRDPYRAITIAVVVLIITCPCALGLAVPMVQVIAAQRLFGAGIMVRDGSAMERLGKIDTVVFDKTGTLTHGRPTLRNGSGIDPANRALAVAMATHSRHPYSRALVAACGSGSLTSIAFERISEHPGFGLEAVAGRDVFRLGRAEWALGGAGQQAPAGELGTILSKNGNFLEAFQFDDDVRLGGREAVAELRQAGLTVEILSGDGAMVAQRLASELGVGTWHAGVLPGEKAGHLSSLASAGHKVLMVGDGLNDAPALAAAHASMAPATAADVGRNAADFVFLRDNLEAVPIAVTLARSAGRLIRQNFALAVVYNVLALPLAVLGLVTPLIAALATSTSSIIVVANALRLNGGTRIRRRLRDRAGQTLPVMDPVR